MAVFFGRRGRPDRLPGAKDPDRAKEAAAPLSRPAERTVITEREIAEAAGTLAEYKRGKANLEERIVQDELWWELRHWEAIRGRRSDKGPSPEPQPTSAWLFNAILNKHADAMDNYPEPIVLPRERSDAESAKALSSVLPVVLEYNEFDSVYSDNWWEKLKHGTAAYGVFWNARKENGLGDIDVRGIDLLKLFWEPGVTDIQKSRNLFIVDLVDTDLLEQLYPEHKGKLSGGTVDVKQYIYDDTVDTSKKSVVVDWYYKRLAPDGRTLLHYAKFVGKVLLYASENDPACRGRGFYDHGLYPVVLDVLFPEKGTPVGFGYVAICKDPQLYIDRLSANILENALMSTKKRYFMSSSTNVNEEEFLDWNRPIVHVEGELSDARIKEITCRPLDDIYVKVTQLKVEEMKDTAANRDVNSGGYGSGVTAAAAIAALQEAGNKASRDMIFASYRAYVGITSLCIELMRQFYDESRAFRITEPGAAGEYGFIELDNSLIRDQLIGEDVRGAPLYRRPVFDLRIRAQRKNPFSRMEQNELAKELYRLGFFSPDKAQEALAATELMEFEGIERVRETIAEGRTLMSVCKRLKEENDALRAADGREKEPPDGAKRSGDAVLNDVPGARQTRGVTEPAGEKRSGDGEIPVPRGTPVSARAEKSSAPLTNGVMQAKTPLPSYAQRLVKRSVPDAGEGGSV